MTTTTITATTAIHDDDDLHNRDMGEGEIIKNTYPPARLGEYTVIQEIAEGTFGKVKSTLRFVVKFLHC